MVIQTINTSDTLEVWRIAYNTDVPTIGDVTTLSTLDKTSTVNAINEINIVIGNLGATYATVAQGAVADTALQPIDIIDDATLGGLTPSPTIIVSQLSIKTYTDGKVIDDATFTAPSTTSAASQLSTKTYVDGKVVEDAGTLGGITPSTTFAPSQSSTQAYVNGKVAGLYNHKGGYDATNNNINLDLNPPAGTIFKGDAYTVNAPGTFFTEFVDIGDVLISNIDDPQQLSDWTRVNKNINIATTTSTGTVTLATDRQNIGNVAVQGNDTRLATATNLIEGIVTVGDLVGNALKLNAPIAPGTNPSLPALDGSLLTGLAGIAANKIDIISETQVFGLASDDPTATFANGIVGGVLTITNFAPGENTGFRVPLTARRFNKIHNLSNITEMITDLTLGGTLLPPTTKQRRTLITLKQGKYLFFVRTQINSIGSNRLEIYGTNVDPLLVINPNPNVNRVVIASGTGASKLLNQGSVHNSGGARHTELMGFLDTTTFMETGGNTVSPIAIYHRGGTNASGVSALGNPGWIASASRGTLVDVPELRSNYATMIFIKLD